MRDNAGVVHYILADHLGSSTVITDGGGAVVGTMKYYPYGAMRSTTGSMPTDKLFTGQQREPEAVSALGLYNSCPEQRRRDGARFYSTLTGRFVSPDPVVQDVKDPQAFNAYSYVRNNPLVYVDPTGMYVDEIGPGAPCGSSSASASLPGDDLLRIVDCALNANCVRSGMTQAQEQDLIGERSFWDDIQHSHGWFVEIIKMIVLGGEKGEELARQLDLIPLYGWDAMGRWFLEPPDYRHGITGLFLRFSLWDLIMGDNTIYTYLSLWQPEALVGAWYWWDYSSLKLWWFMVDLQTGSDFYGHQGAMRARGCSPGQDGCWVWRATMRAAWIMVLIYGSDEVVNKRWSHQQCEWFSFC